jgi:hypothetical protein
VNSLSAHLTAGADHGRLPFHPDCPVCREQRLTGAVSDAVLPARARAGLLAAVLGAGTLVPSSVAAASGTGKPPTAEASQAPAPTPKPRPEPAPTPSPTQHSPGADETQEAPVDEAPQLREILTSPEAGTDTRGEDVSGEQETAPAPPPPGQAPVEPAPAPLGQLPSEPPPVVLPPAPPRSPPTPTPPPSPAPVEQPPAPELEQPTSPRRAGPQAKRQPPERKAKRRQPASQPEPAPQPSSAPPSLNPVTPTESTATVAVSQPTEPPSGPITGSSYTVRPGDSLWSIARRLLGSDASAGQIAREVNRLWELNRDRIGTGDASLIHVGTVLRLQ